MSFLFPTFLFALAAIALPILAHLFNFRSFKTVYFSNVAFLRDIREQTRAKSKLKNLLLLILRILAVVALVLAFAQPFLSSDYSQEEPRLQRVAIYLDNSFSMEAESEKGQLLEVAKNKVHSILDAFPPSTKFYFLTNDFEAKHQHLVSPEQVETFLAELAPSPQTRTLSEVLERQRDFLAGLRVDSLELELQAFVLSDFQTYMADLDRVQPDSNLRVHLLPLPAVAVNNLHIDSCWFESPTRKPGQPEQLWLRLRNGSDQAYQNMTAELFINDTLKALANFDIEPQATQEVSINFNNTNKGIYHGRVSISDYPITYDNDFFFAYTIAESLKVLAIHPGEAGRNLQALLRAEPYFDFTLMPVNSVQPSLLQEFQVIFLEGVGQFSSGLVSSLAAFVANGGTLVLFPDLEAPAASYQPLLQALEAAPYAQALRQDSRVAEIDYQDEIFANVFQKVEPNADLPSVSAYFSFARSVQTLEKSLLSTQNGSPLLKRAPHGLGQAYIFAMGLDAESSNFAEHPLFVPTVLNIGLFSQFSGQIYQTIGQSGSLELNRSLAQESQSALHLSLTDGSYDLIPKQNNDLGAGKIRLFFESEVKRAGNYRVWADQRDLLGVAFNYDRQESDLRYLDAEELGQKLEELGLANFDLLETQDEFLASALEEIGRGGKLWKWLLLAALLFLATEVLVARLWKD